MEIKQFIEKAIEGGWKPFPDERVHKKVEIEDVGIHGFNAIFTTKVNVRRLAFFQIILSPLAWQAVGKVEGWKRNAIIQWYDSFPNQKEREKYRGIESWKFQMHRMIDALAEGKTIEEYLKTL